jgi:hypothetical protein
MELLSIDPSCSCLRSPVLHHLPHPHLPSLSTPQRLLLGHHRRRALGDLRLRIADPLSTQTNPQSIL